MRVPFHDEELEVVRDEDRVLVSIRHVCDVLGLSVARQIVKLHAKPWACVALKAMQVGDQVREVACIDLDSLPMWLATIEPRRVREELREKLAVYQREAAKVLRDYFFGAREQRPALLSAPSATTRSAALRRLETVERALEIVAQDIAVLTSIKRKVYVAEMHTRIVMGLTWTWDATQIVTAAFTVLPDPVVEARFEEVRACWTRLSAAYKVL